MAVAVRTQPNSLRPDSDRPKPAKAALRSESDRLPIDPNLAAGSDKAAFLALVDEARIRAGLSRKEMAFNAGVLESVISETLNGTRGNFAIHWMDRQPREFWLAFNKITADRYGLTPQKEDEVWAERLGELVTLLVKSRRLG